MWSAPAERSGGALRTPGALRRSAPASRSAPTERSTGESIDRCPRISSLISLWRGLLFPFLYFGPITKLLSLDFNNLLYTFIHTNHYLYY